jgi:hypothetical protein
MPQATNLTLANGAATPVNKTFTLLAPAAGFGGLTEWAVKEGDFSGSYTRLTAMVRKTGTDGGSNGSNRVCQIKLKVPYTVVVDGVPNIIDIGEFNGSFTTRGNLPDTVKADLVAFVGNFLKTTLARDLVVDGAPAS